MKSVESSQMNMVNNEQSDIDSNKIFAQLKRWQERLLDLRQSNPLLGLNRSRTTRLKILEPSMEELFSELVLKNKELRLPRVIKKEKILPTDEEILNKNEPEYEIIPGDVSFFVEPQDLNRKLNRIYLNAKTSVEEQGITTLHISFGVLFWEDPELGKLMSPLLLAPCLLQNYGPSAPMRLSLSDEELKINPALALYLKEKHRVILPDFPGDFDGNKFEKFFDETSLLVSERKWRIEEQIWMATFSFFSLVLYEDLKINAKSALKNPVIVALSRAMPLKEEPDIFETIDLDSQSNDEVPVPVLSSDSSQLRALTVARAEKNVVIHGPPGTGKSQTITNLIADALGEGKTVLFVSAKMAALEVVHRRLTELGLGRFCLEAYSSKAGKAKIIEELRRTLSEAESELSANQFEVHYDEFLRVREDLNKYVRELHKKREPLGISVYEGIGKIAKLIDVPDIRGELPWPDITKVTKKSLQEAIECLRELAIQAEVFDKRESHPWRGLVLKSERKINPEDLVYSVKFLHEIFGEITNQLKILKPFLGPIYELSYSKLLTLGKVLYKLRDIEKMPFQWWVRQPEELEEVAALLEEAATKAEEESLLLEEHRNTINLSPEETVNLLQSVEEPLKYYTRKLLPSFWKWRKIVNDKLCEGKNFRYSFLKKTLIRAKRLIELEDFFQNSREKLEIELGCDLIRNTSLLQTAAKQLRIAAELKKVTTLLGIKVPNDPIPFNEEIKLACTKIFEKINNNELSKTIYAVNNAWEGKFWKDHDINSAPLCEIEKRCREIVKEPTRIHEWIILEKILAKCKNFGLDKFIFSLGNVSSKHLVECFEKRFYQLWVNEYIQDSEDLSLFSAKLREEKISRFQELDEEVRHARLIDIIQKASEPARRVAAARGKLGTSSEVGILRRELEKRRRFKPLRKLFSETPNVLLALKPCMLMSPISVATFLEPGKVTFDLVVFDEASQLPTPEGISAVLRGKQVIVAGDSKQLPPTTFFMASSIVDKGDDEQEEGEEYEPLESFLDDCVALFPFFYQVHLRWHYRSRDERLIAFSNYQFYREKPLITFPAPYRPEKGQGVRLVYVPDGIWDRGKTRTNRREAEEVLKLIFEHLKQWPDRSLGVAAMNINQRDLILDLLNEAIIKDPEIGEKLNSNTKEPFFVKALENVQGDERDTIIISVGYAKDYNGKLSSNFGPLNKEGGWRRLNVLVTRARWETILVTSIRSQELDRLNSNNRGVLALRDFIQYAENGGNLLQDFHQTIMHVNKDFEEVISETLEEQGYHADIHIGNSEYRLDVAVKHPKNPERYALGILSDGINYKMAETARDREILRHEVLENLGWQLSRVWSIEWLRNRENVAQSLLFSIQQAEQNLKKNKRRKNKVLNTTDIIDIIVRNHLLKTKNKAKPIRKYSAGIEYEQFDDYGYREYLMSYYYQEELQKQIVNIVSVEGPIHKQLLIKRLKEINDVDRIGNNILDNIEIALEALIDEGELVCFEEHFYKCSGKELKTFRIPSDSEIRKPTWIPIEEIKLAVLHVVEDEFGCDAKALPKAIAKIFGFNRTPLELAKKVNKAIAELIKEGKLKKNGKLISIT